jgi:DNA replication protein DnaC
MSGMLRLLRPDGGLKVEDLVGLHLLAIDEWGERGRMSEWATQQIRSVIDGRYRGRKATIIASNHTIKDVQAREDMGGWVIGSRFVEGLGEGEGRSITLSFDHRIGRPVPAER